MELWMTDRKILVFFCSILVAGMVVLAGCTRSGEPALPAVTPGINPGTSEHSTVVAPLPSCAIPLTGSPSESPGFAAYFLATELLTKPTDRSVTVSIVPKASSGIFSVYGTSPGSYSCRTPTVQGKGNSAVNNIISGLAADMQYYYRICIESSTAGQICGPEHMFHTARSPGRTFTFGIQADSHPEREKTMFNTGLYTQTMQNVALDNPDFFISLGDDFSIDPLIDRGQVNRQAVNAVYLSQRKYLGIPGSSTPIFLVNGNHEQAARYLLDGTPDNAAVYAGTARMEYFPQPVPDGFYTGDTELVPYVGLPGDYYSWTWGDALFVVIDPYWHSPVAVDNVAGKNAHQNKDLWEITLGDTQYQWFKETLEGSSARYKFVFAHHVEGTGRGGVEEAGLYEWGGKNSKGTWEFGTRRPGWDMTIQQMMAKNHVTVFFQGHDHLFAKQELDGVIYQEVPIPADPTYSMFNADAYTSGTKLPNTGYLRITVSPQNATVDYVKTYLAGKERAGEKNGMVAYSYTVTGTSPTGVQQ
jgi:hypothetical protein